MLKTTTLKRHYSAPPWLKNADHVTAYRFWFFENQLTYYSWLHPRHEIAKIENVSNKNRMKMVLGRKKLLADKVFTIKSSGWRSFASCLVITCFIIICWLHWKAHFSERKPPFLHESSNFLILHNKNFESTSHWLYNAKWREFGQEEGLFAVRNGHSNELSWAYRIV